MGHSGQKPCKEQCEAAAKGRSWQQQRVVCMLHVPTDAEKSFQAILFPPSAMPRSCHQKTSIPSSVSLLCGNQDQALPIASALRWAGTFSVLLDNMMLKEMQQLVQAYLNWCKGCQPLHGDTACHTQVNTMFLAAQTLYHHRVAEALIPNL